MTKGYVDFADVKKTVSIEAGLAKLGIKLHKAGSQLRGQCPICDSKNERGFVVTPAKGLWYCFSEQAGGDVIQLTAAVRQVDVREAALWLIGGTVNSERSTVEQSTVTVRKDHAEGFQALDYLDPAHAAVQAVGFDPDTAAALGIGYAPKGLLRGTVAIPVRLEDGTLAGYVGITEAKLPPRFHLPAADQKVVRLVPKKTA